MLLGVPLSSLDVWVTIEYLVEVDRAASSINRASARLVEA